MKWGLRVVDWGRIKCRNDDSHNSNFQLATWPWRHQTPEVHTCMELLVSDRILGFIACLAHVICDPRGVTMWQRDVNSRSSENKTVEKSADEPRNSKLKGLTEKTGVEYKIDLLTSFVQEQPIMRKDTVRSSTKPKVGDTQTHCFSRRITSAGKLRLSFYLPWL